jgi:putative peptidoglycan lipid II flippase
VKALFAAVIVNVALKVLLMGSYAQVGLAFATSVGVWINFLLLLWFAHRANLFSFDDRLRASIVKLVGAGAALGAALWLGGRLLSPVFASWVRWGDAMQLVVLGVLGVVVYFGVVGLLFGRRSLAAFMERSRVPSVSPPPDLG